MNDIHESKHFNQKTGVMTSKVTYDNSDVLASNKEARDNESKRNKFRHQGNSGLVHVGKIHLGDIARLKTLGYDLMSPDPAEQRKALLYIQAQEPFLLKTTAKPFAKKKQTWV